MEGEEEVVYPRWSPFPDMNEACLDCAFPAHFLHTENHRCVSSIVLKVYCAECGCLQIKHTRLFKFIYLCIVPVYTITP